MSGARTHRQDRRAALVLCCVFVLAYLPFYSGRFTSTDELAVFEMTRSLHENGDLAVPRIQHTGVGAGGTRFSLFAPGQSVLALPHYAAAQIAEPRLPATALSDLSGPNIYVHGSNRFSGSFEIFAVGLYSPLVTAMLVAAYFLFQRDLGARPRNALFAAVVLGAGTYVASLSSLFLRHATESLLILLSLYGLRRWVRDDRRRDLCLAASCASAILLIRVPSAVYGVPFGIALLAALVGRVRQGRDARALVLDALAIGLPPLTAIATHVAVNTYRWGTPFASPMTAQHTIMDNPIWLGIAGLLFSPGVSVFAYSPVLLLSPWMLAALRRREPLVVGTAVGTFVCFVCFVGAYRHWPGLWTAPGPRYLYLCIPLLLLPLGPWLDAEPRRRRAVGWLAALGATLQVALLLTPWEATVAHMGYAPSGPEGPFLWSLASGPIPGTFETLFAQDERSPWLWKLATGWLGHPAAPQRAAAWLGAWALLFAPAVWLLRTTIRAMDPDGGSAPVRAGD